MFFGSFGGSAGQKEEDNAEMLRALRFAEKKYRHPRKEKRNSVLTKRIKEGDNIGILETCHVSMDRW